MYSVRRGNDLIMYAERTYGRAIQDVIFSIVPRRKLYLIYSYKFSVLSIYLVANSG